MTTSRDGDLGVCLWFDDQAEAAVAHYLDIFDDGRIAQVSRRDPTGPALTVAFELRGRRFLALNGGPHFKFTPAISLVVDGADQAEIDYFWRRLGEGGTPSRCGWLADKFGLSWQIVPRDLPALLSRGPAVMQALMRMDKLDIAALERAGQQGGRAMNDNTGKFVWYEWMGADLAGAVDFYRHVVGWDIVASPMTAFPYQMASSAGYPVGGLLTTPSEAQGTPPCWTGYIWVESVDAAVDKLKAAGGRAMRPPTDIPGIGRFAVVADSQGAPFALFREAGGNPPPPPTTSLGLVGWRELHAADGEAALRFYTGQFGWIEASQIDMGPMGVYRLFDNSGQQGGMMTKTPQGPGPCWLYYFNVEAADAAAARVTANGGKVLNGPHEVPGGAWATQCADREGAMFGLVAPKR